MRNWWCGALLLIVFGSHIATAQNLSAGDVAITGMNATNPDEFAFVALVDISAGTVITFTDHGWLASGAFRNTEGEFVFTAANTVVRGTVIQVLSADGAPQFAVSGDQVFAFQGTVGNPSFLYGLNVSGPGVWQADAVNSNTSALPPTLQNGLTAVAIDDCNNVAYNGLTTGTKSELLALIGDKGNWICDDAARLDLSNAFTVTGAGNSIPIFTQAFADTTILAGAAFTFTFDADDADNDPLTFGITPALEAGAAFDTNTGVFSWTPGLGQVGTYDYQVTVSDGTDTASNSISVSVVEILGPTAPIFTSGTETILIDVGSDVSITFVAEDPQGTNVTIELLAAPAQCPLVTCSTWSQQNSTISWSANEPDILGLTVRATDEDGASTTADVIVGQLGALYENAPSREALFDLVASNAPDQTLGYDMARDTIYAVIDLDNDGFVRGIYTDFAVEFTGGDPSTTMFQGGINAEHIWPQSQGAGEEPQRSDMISLFPAKSNVNSSRSNKPFAEINDEQAESWFRLAEELSTIPTTNINEYSESRIGQFEPRESRKGDVARAMLYFNTIHSAQASPAFWALQEDMIVVWAAFDPASPAEIERAFRIQKYQGNINPYLLDQSLLFRLWDFIVESNETDELPILASLGGNYPNPFRDKTTIPYRLDRSGHVTIEVFDLLGKRIMTLEDGFKPAGDFQVSFGAENLASGLYYYVMTSGGARESRKMLVVN
jgi:Endonuclease I/Putative Ig domain/Secretion system C-terminal sorting domain